MKQVHTKRRVRVLISRRSEGWGVGLEVQRALSEYWDVAGIGLTFQFSKSAEEGRDKALAAVADGVDTVLVVGGDGAVNSVGSALINSGVALGVIPAGSGNGFGRHFGIPLNPARAAEVLVRAERRVIDVGTANGRSFFVTCSMAWDAALVRTFERSPMRGILPYVFAAASEFIGYTPQPIEVELDGRERMTFPDPMIFTVANLTQYGGGARIAPRACPDDGALELVVILRQDATRVLARLPRLFDGTLDQLPEVVTRRFSRLVVRRARPASLQLDGEMVEAPANVEVGVLPKALTVLVPARPEG